MELGRLKGAYFAMGSRVTAAGLTDAFFTYQPRVLCLDEIDKVPMDVTAVLLSVMETGDILETKYKRQRGLKPELAVFAAGNTDKTIAPELISRFGGGVLHFKPYSKGEFLDVCQGYLARHEGVPTTTSPVCRKKLGDLLDAKRLAPMYAPLCPGRHLQLDLSYELGQMVGQVWKPRTRQAAAFSGSHLEYLTGRG